MLDGTLRLFVLILFIVFIVLIGLGIGAGVLIIAFWLDFDVGGASDDEGTHAIFSIGEDIIVEGSKRIDLSPSNIVGRVRDYINEPSDSIV